VVEEVDSVPTHVICRCIAILFLVVGVAHSLLSLASKPDRNFGIVKIVYLTRLWDSSPKMVGKHRGPASNVQKLRTRLARFVQGFNKEGIERFRCFQPFEWFRLVLETRIPVFLRAIRRRHIVL
jgi:hypothetical protein